MWSLYTHIERQKHKVRLIDMELNMHIHGYTNSLSCLALTLPIALSSASCREPEIVQQIESLYCPPNKDSFVVENASKLHRHCRVGAFNWAEDTWRLQTGICHVLQPIGSFTVQLPRKEPTIFPVTSLSYIVSC